MKTILFTTFCIISFNGFTQNFPKDSAEWSIKFTDFNLPPYGGYITKTCHFALHGDTIIQNLQYSKLYKDTISLDSSFIFSHSQLIGFTREGLSKKVFLRDTNSSESLIFDFSLQIGDTLSTLSPNGVVTGIDSILIGNSYKPRFSVDPGLTLSPLEYIEGVGYLHGQGVFSNWRYFNIGVHKAFELLCLKEKGNIIYNSGSCYIDASYNMTAINDLTQLNSKAIVYPNPFNFKTTVAMDLELKNADMVIKNILGEESKKIKNIYGQQIIIDRNDLVSGIYFYQLTEGNKVLSTGKLIVE